jgi:hypothetical protein
MSAETVLVSRQKFAHRGRVSACGWCCESLEERIALAGLVDMAASTQPAGDVATEVMTQEGRFGDLTYVVTSGTVTISGFYAGATKVRIPSTIDRLPVTAIGAWAFFGHRGIEAVVMPDSVRMIGDNAFLECSALRDVRLSRQLVSIGSDAFRSCESLVSISLPQRLTTIGRGAFAGCPSLTAVTLPRGITFLDVGVFYGCTGLLRIRYPSRFSGIGDYAFFGCSRITTLPVPATVTSLGSHAFAECIGLRHVSIPGSVQAIGDGLFRGCTGLTAAILGTGVRSISDSMFSGCSSLQTVAIPRTVTSIGPIAFYACAGLTRMTIPDGVTSIGMGSFLDCTALAVIDFQGAPPALEGTLAAPATTVARFANSNTAWAPYIASTFGGVETRAVSVPQAPTGVTVGSNRRWVALRWIAPQVDGGAPITDYIIQVSANGGATWKTVNDCVATATSATVRTPAVGRSSVFRVAAVNAFGVGAFSIATVPRTPPR